MHFRVRIVTLESDMIDFQRLFMDATLLRYTIKAMLKSPPPAKNARGFAGGFARRCFVQRQVLKKQKRNEKEVMAVVLESFIEKAMYPVGCFPNLKTW